MRRRAQGPPPNVEGQAVAVSARLHVFFGAVAIAAAFVLLMLPPGELREVEEVLIPPFRRDEGHAFLSRLEAAPAVAKSGDTAASLAVLEDGRTLGPGDSLHADIRHRGNGRYAINGQWLYLSASDNTDPNANGRRYVIRYAATYPLAIPLAALTIGAVALFGLADLISNRFLRQRRKSAAQFLLSFLFVVGLLEGVAGYLLANTLAHNPGAARLYNFVFQRETAPQPVAGSAANFIPHPYFIYSLNPSAEYLGIRQFNETFMIRRTEAIRPRTEVAWRALVLGGSTTFGEKIPREEEVWVHRLESLLRRQLGRNIDVINGGVGGYNLVENMIHYMLLLRRLDPDLVVLYVGINDVDQRLIGTLKSDYSNSRIPWSGDAGQLPTPTRMLAPFRFYRYYFLRRFANAGFPHILNVVQRPYPPIDQWAPMLDRNGPEVYREHLDQFVRMLHADGRRVTIIPQVFVARPGEPSDIPYKRGVVEHNEVNESVARARGVPYASSILNSDIASLDYLLDNCHFNLRGNIRFAELVFDFLKASALVPGNDHDMEKSTSR